MWYLLAPPRQLSFCAIYSLRSLSPEISDVSRTERNQAETNQAEMNQAVRNHAETNQTLKHHSETKDCAAMVNALKF